MDAPRAGAPPRARRRVRDRPPDALPAFERSYSLTDPPTLDDVRTVLAAHSRDAAEVYRAELYAAVSAGVNVGLRLLAEVAEQAGETRAQVLRRVALDGVDGVEVDAPWQPSALAGRRDATCTNAAQPGGPRACRRAINGGLREVG
ncbi:hypothetical protein [Actinomadura sp. 3N407]|uniref:hypothetical protein n=1 Tax=Actinomadura sp. 3N407 TaxID=3457423 RepID=UPI003FCC407F